VREVYGLVKAFRTSWQVGDWRRRTSMRCSFLVAGKAHIEVFHSCPSLSSSSLCSLQHLRRDRSRSKSRWPRPSKARSRGVLASQLGKERGGESGGVALRHDRIVAFQRGGEELGFVAAGRGTGRARSGAARAPADRGSARAGSWRQRKGGRTRERRRCRPARRSGPLRAPSP